MSLILKDGRAVIMVFHKHVGTMPQILHRAGDDAIVEGGCQAAGQDLPPFCCRAPRGTRRAGGKTPLDTHSLTRPAGGVRMLPFERCFPDRYAGTLQESCTRCRITAARTAR